jgi:hypothetical protein
VGRAQTVPAPRPATDEPIPSKAFEVSADPERRHGTNRTIRSLPMTMNVYTRTFIDQRNAVDIEAALKALIPLLRVSHT